MYVLKESEKELCNAKWFSLEQNIGRGDMALPLFNGYYKQSTPPKAQAHSQSLENSLNKNKEFMKNGCHIFHLEYDPSENARMDTVWTHFIELGRSELVLGRRSKIFVLPALGLQNPTQITQVRRYMKFHIKFTTVSWIHSHATITNLNKWVEVSMTDPNTPPPRKFTTLRHKYMDLHTPEGLEVFHAVIPRVESATRGSSIDCLCLAGNPMAKDLLTKIMVCLSAWWWHLFKCRGYTKRTAKSLMDSFDYEASLVADQSTFDRSTWTVTTQFANSDDFLAKSRLN